MGWMTPEEEEAGWAKLRERWTDPEAHREWLAGFADIAGLARAGQRYRDALSASPGDPIAARWRDEILKRATVQGLASLPRTQPAAALPRWLKGAVIALLSVLLATALWWAAQIVVSAAGE